MAKFQCSDCPRIVTRAGQNHKRCKRCAKNHAMEYKAQWLRDNKEWHAGYQACLMRAKRRDPSFVDKEREALKNRMRRLRLKRKREGLNNAGQPFRYSHGKWAKHRERERTSQPESV